MKHRSVLGLGVTTLVAALSQDAGAQEWEAQPGEAQPPEAQPEPTHEARTPPPADGEAPPPGKGGTSVDVEVAGEVAYMTPPIRGGATPFGAGFGARVGLDFSGFYVGVSVLDFLGGKDVDVSYRSLLYGLEIGYGFRVPAFGGTVWVLRPRVGVGDAAVYYTDPSLKADVVTTASGSSSSASDTLTVNNVFVQPGVTLELASRSYFAAMDGSMLVLPGIAYGGADATTWVSYGLQLQLGFHF